MKHARQKQEDPLNLQSLPMVAPPRDGWPAVEARLRRDVRRRNLHRFGAVGLAAAAAVALALGLHLRGPAQGVDPVLDPAVDGGQGSQLAIQQAAGDPSAADTAQREDTLEALVGLSQELEARLRLLRVEGGRLPAPAVVYQVELEDLVVQVDEELSMQPDSLGLWNQRVGLLMDLEQFYRDHLRREYQHLASL